MTAIAATRFQHVTPKHLALLIGQSLDGATFVIFFLLLPAALAGEITERNPIVNFLMHNFGVLSVMLVKVGLGLVVVWRARPYIQKPGLRYEATTRIYKLMFTLAAFSGFVGFAFNTYAIFQIMGWM